MDLTPAGEQVANQIAMSADDDGVALLTALLDAAGEDRPEGGTR
jgi:hypothetical protein